MSRLVYCLIILHRLWRDHIYFSLSDSEALKIQTNQLSLTTFRIALSAYNGVNLAK